MTEHWAALEADFQRFYGTDLRRLLWVERVGCRRLWDLIAGLPVESSFQHELSKRPPPPKPGGWRKLARRMTGG